MNTLLTAITLLVLGINISAACNLYEMLTCVKNKVDCSVAAECEYAAMSCGQTEQCYQNEPKCQNSILVLASCGGTHSCAPPFKYRYTVKTACVPMQSAASVPRLTVFSGFSAITISLLAYFSKA